MSFRKPLQGFNHNIRYKERVYHVQTEDSGLSNPHIFSHLFFQGQIIASERTVYHDLIDDPDSVPKVRKLMQEQHKRLMKLLRRGEFDQKIIMVIGTLEPREVVSNTAEPAADAQANDQTGRALDPQPPLQIFSPSTESLQADSGPVFVESATQEILPDDILPFDEVTEQLAVCAPNKQQPQVPAMAKAEPPDLKSLPRSLQPKVDIDFEITEPVDISELHDFKGADAELSAMLDKSDAAAKDHVLSRRFDNPGPSSIPQPADPEVKLMFGSSQVSASATKTAASGSISSEIPSYKAGQRQEGKLPLSPEQSRIGSLPPRSLFEKYERNESARRSSQPSRIIDKPLLPGLSRFVPPEEASPAIKKQRSGVYIVSGCPPQHPPEPENQLRAKAEPLSEPAVKFSSTPHRYNAPGRGGGSSVQITERKRQPTGTYEGKEPSLRPHISSSKIEEEAGTTEFQAVSPEARDFYSNRFGEKTPVVKRPVVIINQPVKVGSKACISPPSNPPHGVRPSSSRQPSKDIQPLKPSRPVRSPSHSSVFGPDIISERSLDEVILAYLSEDCETNKE